MKKKPKNRHLLTKKAQGNNNASKFVQQKPTHENLLAEARSLHNAGNFSRAEIIYRNLLAFYPENVGIMSLLGTVLAQQGHLEEALPLMEKVISTKPHNVEAYYNIGRVLQDLKRYDDALANYDKAIAINPNYAVACNNRGLIFYNLKQYNAALADYDKAIAINPNYTEAYNNRGLTFYSLKQYNAALADYDKAIAINPDHADAYLNKSLLKLLLGEYEEGWNLYEWRWKSSYIDKSTIRIFQKPLWLGKESLAGKIILLHAEQGFGDTILFCRYAPMVEALGAKVLLEVQKPLVALLASLVMEEGTVIAQGSPIPEFDFHCPLMSLPLAFKTIVNTVPADIPYLYSAPEKRKAWRERLGIQLKPRIGLAWSGNAQNTTDHNRSIALNLLTPLLEYDCEYHSLQKEVRAEDAELFAKSKIISHADSLKDFSDTAALISEMDIVISVDTSVAHLAGALGKNLWVMLHLIPDLRWMTVKENKPWYPAARMFRQQQFGDWDSVIARVKTALAIFASNFEMPSERHNASEPIQQKLVPADLLSRAISLHRTGDLNNAEHIYQTLLTFYPEHVSALSLLGTLHCQRGNLEEGIRLLDKAITSDPSYAEAYNNRGLALYHLRRYSEALEDYDKAIALNFNYAEAYNNRENALRKLQQNSDVLTNCDKYIPGIKK